MNNPNNLSLKERGITPTQDANKGINYRMSKERRAKKAKSNARRGNVKASPNSGGK
jgi:hypothetical protein